MFVRYTLSMGDLVVHGERFDSVVIEWEEEATHADIRERSRRWIAEKNFLTSRMNGLNEVGESSLIIKPIKALTE